MSNLLTLVTSTAGSLFSGLTGYVLAASAALTITLGAGVAIEAHRLGSAQEAVATAEQVAVDAKTALATVQKSEAAANVAVTVERDRADAVQVKFDSLQAKITSQSHTAADAPAAPVLQDLIRSLGLATPPPVAAPAKGTAHVKKH
jgi:hypothetical protein